MKSREINYSISPWNGIPSENILYIIKQVCNTLGSISVQYQNEPKKIIKDKSAIVLRSRGSLFRIKTTQCKSCPYWALLTMRMSVLVKGWYLVLENCFEWPLTTLLGVNLVKADDITGSRLTSKILHASDSCPTQNLFLLVLYSHPVFSF